MPAPEPLSRLISLWPERWQDDYRERAAIKEYDANMPRRQAMYEAERETRQLAERERNHAMDRSPAALPLK